MNARKIMKQKYGKIFMAILVLFLILGTTLAWAADEVYDLSRKPGDDPNTFYYAAEFDGVFWEVFRPEGSTGTGVFKPFLRVQASKTEVGYNTDGSVEFDTKSGIWTHSITMAEIPIESGEWQGQTYTGYEFLIDINETTSDPILIVDDYQFWITRDPMLVGYNATNPNIGIGTQWSPTNSEPEWVGEIDWDFGNNMLIDRQVIMDYMVAAGSGNGDYRVLIPQQYFMDALARYNARYPGEELTPQTAYLVLYVEHNSSDDGFEEWGILEKPTATKSGMKFHDLDADGVKDATEPGLPGWTIYVDYNGDGVLDTNEPFAVTGADGTYTITGINPGTYKVREEAQEGWTVSFPALGYYEETFESDDDITGNDFGNWTPATKSGMKFHDLDADGVKDATEPGLPGWTIYVDYNGDGVLDTNEPFAVTGADGTYTITGINPGTYKVREEAQEGWTVSFPALGYYEETFESDDDITGNDFGNWTTATKSGYKFYDMNSNGIWDEGEPGLEGWVIFIDANNNGILDTDEISTTTGANGYYEFTGLTPGSYYFREVLRANWYNTYPVGGVYYETLLSGDISDNNNFGNVYYRDETAWRFGNIENMSLTNSTNWGWTDGPLTLPTEIGGVVRYTNPLYAAAGQNVISNGYNVGSVEIVITRVSDKRYTVQVNYSVIAGVQLMETHVWIGQTPLPQTKKGVYTDAPGQMKYTDGQIVTINNPSQIYVAAHSVVRIFME